MKTIEYNSMNKNMMLSRAKIFQAGSQLSLNTKVI